VPLAPLVSAWLPVRALPTTFIEGWEVSRKAGNRVGKESQMTLGTLELRDRQLLCGRG